jgi:hypothetical protein
MMGVPLKWDTTQRDNFIVLYFILVYILSSHLSPIISLTALSSLSSLSTFSSLVFLFLLPLYDGGTPRRDNFTVLKSSLYFLLSSVSYHLSHCSLISLHSLHPLLSHLSLSLTSLHDGRTPKMEYSAKG